MLCDGWWLVVGGRTRTHGCLYSARPCMYIHNAEHSQWYSAQSVVHIQAHAVVAPGTIGFRDMQLGEQGLGQVYCWGAESGGMEHGFDMLGVGAADMQDWTYRSLLLHLPAPPLLLHLLLHLLVHFPPPPLPSSTSLLLHCSSAAPPLPLTGCCLASAERRALRTLVCRGG